MAKTKSTTDGKTGTLTVFDGTVEVGMVEVNLADFPQDIVDRAAVYGLCKLGRDTYTSIFSESSGGTAQDGLDGVKARYATLQGGEWREKAPPGLGSTIDLRVACKLYPEQLPTIEDAAAFRDVGQEDGVWKSITKHPIFKSEKATMVAADAKAKAKGAEALPSI